MISNRFTVTAARIVCSITVCALIFCSCESNSVEDYPFIPIESDTELEKELTAITLILSSEATHSLTEKANELADALEAQTGVPTSVKSEWETPSDDDYIILLGMLEDSRSSTQMNDLRSNDYVCREDNGVLILGGKNDQATINAINKFMDEILPVSNKYYIVPNMGGFTHKENYAISKFLLNNIELGNYVISADTDNEDILSFANSMREKISQKTGYWLSIEDKANTQANSYTIDIDIIEDKYETGIYRITPKKNGFIISAKDINGIEMSTQKFISLLISDINTGIVEKTISREISLAYAHASTSVFSYIHDSKSELSPNQIANVLAPTKNDPQDLLLFGKLDRNNGDEYSANLTKYNKVDTNNYVYTKSNYSCTPIYYAETNGLTIEGYTFDNNELTIVLVRISGEPTESAKIPLPSSIAELSLPTVAVIHTIGSEKISILDPSESYITQIFDVSDKHFANEVHFTCYASIDCIDVKLSDISCVTNVKCIEITGKTIEI